MDHVPYATNSLLKIITDIFASDETSNLFYKNDVAVLIDIVLRNLVDNLPNYEVNSFILLLKIYDLNIIVFNSLESKLGT